MGGRATAYIVCKPKLVSNPIEVLSVVTILCIFLLLPYLCVHSAHLLPDPTKKKWSALCLVMFQGLLCQGNHFTHIMSKLCILSWSSDSLCWYVWSQYKQSSALHSDASFLCVRAFSSSLSWLLGWLIARGGSCNCGVVLLYSQHFWGRKQERKHERTKVVSPVWDTIELSSVMYSSSRE